MVLPFRIAATAAGLLVAAFGVFGLLASFEPGNGIGWTIGYVVLLLACAAACVLPWINTPRS